MNAVSEKPSQLKSRNGIAATLQSVQIEGRLDGLVLTMTTRQHYRNMGHENLEAVYTFPLPWGATMLGLNAAINGHRLQGTVLEKKQATQRYEKAIDEGNTPVMVERTQSGLYTANLGNLKPKEEAVIEIEYAQLLRFQQGQIRVTIPTTVAPRYGDEHETGRLQPHESVMSEMLVQYPLTVNITLAGEMSKAEVQCPSHRVGIAKDDENLVVHLNQDGFLDRDFVLLLQGLTNQSMANLAHDVDGVAVMASFCPTIPAQGPQPLLLKIMVDCSGSMAGDSIASARRALHEVLKELDDHDWISYSRFGSDVVHDVAGLVPCKSSNIKKVARLIAKTEADLGGTEMNNALISTFSNDSGPQWKKFLGAKDAPAQDRNVLLITDGEMWGTDEVIQTAKISRHRIFAIGVGSAPVESLLREVADKTGGACELVSPNQDVAEVIVRMFRRMRGPSSSQVQIDWGKPVLWQSKLPAFLYDGDTLHLSARLDGEPTIAPVLSWVTKEGPISASANAIQSMAGQLLPRLVAAQQLAETSSEEKRQEIALQYQLVTDQTNLILVHMRDAEDRVEGLPALDNIKHMLAAGWGATGSVVEPVYGSMATPSVWRRNPPNVAAGIDALASGGLDDFEIPDFLRKEPEDSLAGVSEVHICCLPPHVAHVTPIGLLEAFDRASRQSSISAEKFVKAMSRKYVPDAISEIVDELTDSLNSDAKAWALVIKWMASALSDQFVASRQGLRLLRQILQGVDASALASVQQRLIRQLAPLATEWSVECLDY